MNRIGFLAVLALILAAGCGKPGETTVVGADGSRVTASKDGTHISAVDGQGNKTNVEASEKGGLKGSVESADGKSTAYEMGGETTVTAEDMGISFYPGATKRSKDMDTKVNAAGKATMMATRFTTDDVKKVFDFYAEQSWVKTKALTGDAGAVSGENDKGQIGITVGKLDGGTVISMTLQSK